MQELCLLRRDRHHRPARGNPRTRTANIVRWISFVPP
jgi:hypothetical protein